MKHRLSTYLRQLEAESIQIMREVVAEFSRPIMLYSIGKDSSVMLHLALKAFYPSALPFPLLHVDTTWKFREMISFRDETARRLGVELSASWAWRSGVRVTASYSYLSSTYQSSLQIATADTAPQPTEPGDLFPSSPLHRGRVWIGLHALLF